MEYSIYKANVVKGQGLASKELLPTLNLDTTCLPEDFKYGVYSCYVFLCGSRFPAMMHYGTRSTDSNISLELHVIDVILDEHFVEITFQPCNFIRDIMKFDSLQDLKKQLGLDLINIVNNV